MIESRLISVLESLYTLDHINRSNKIIEKQEEYACHARLHSQAQRSSAKG